MIAKFSYQGFQNDEMELVDSAAASVAKTIFNTIKFPELRSQTITIICNRAISSPMYVANGNNEVIIVNSEHDRPWQYAFQIARELGHLSASQWNSHPREEGHMRIEEALCECHSLKALQEMSKIDGDLQCGTVAYCSILDKKYSNAEVNPEWFSHNGIASSQATSLTSEALYMSRYIVKNVYNENILRDNRLINQLPVGLSLNEHLVA